ncbi:MAG TPA: methionyl-tRNA formyltransferase [Terriglobia bacterium]|nr:methionyl-tRNA formyltransferase [Terriglobia bacterium]
MRLVFMGTPEFAVPTLWKLLKSSHQVTSVFTQSDKCSGRGEKMTMSPVKKLSLEAGVPVYQPNRLNSEEWEAVFQSLQVDAYSVVAYGRILPAWLLGIPPQGAINLHASLLPKYRGAAPINWAIANGEVITGITTMKIDTGLDTGGILLQEPVAIGPEETASDLHDRLAVLGADLMLRTLDALESRTLSPIPQSNELASYAPMLKKSDGLIDWAQPSSKINDRIRGLNPWPGTYTFLNGNMLRIWKSRPVEINSSTQAPGVLVRDPNLGGVVFCHPGQLQLLEVQQEGRKRITATEFLNGLRFGEGQTLLLGK